MKVSSETRHILVIFAVFQCLLMMSSRIPAAGLQTCLQHLKWRTGFWFRVFFLKHDLNIRCLKCRHVHKKRALSIYSILQWFCMYQNLKDEAGDIHAMQPLCQVGLRGGDHFCFLKHMYSVCVTCTSNVDGDGCLLLNPVETTAMRGFPKVYRNAMPDQFGEKPSFTKTPFP